MIARGETGNPAEVIQVEPEVVKAKTGSDPGGPGVSAGSRLDILTPEEQVYSVRKLFNLCDTDDVMFGHAANPKIVDVIADLLGCDDIKVYGDQLFMKNPGGVGSAIPWHQDSYSWMEISPRDLISCWTSMDNATIENGCTCSRSLCAFRRSSEQRLHRPSLFARLPQVGHHRADAGRQRQGAPALGGLVHGALAGGAGGAAAGQLQLPPLDDDAHEQREPQRPAAARLCDPLHEGDLGAGGRPRERRQGDDGQVQVLSLRAGALLSRSRLRAWCDGVLCAP